jgi:hypothetical protein
MCRSNFPASCAAVLPRFGYAEDYGKKMFVFARGLRKLCSNSRRRV